MPDVNDPVFVYEHGRNFEQLGLSSAERKIMVDVRLGGIVQGIELRETFAAD